MQFVWSTVVSRPLYCDELLAEVLVNYVRINCQTTFFEGFRDEAMFLNSLLLFSPLGVQYLLHRDLFQGQFGFLFAIL